VHHLELRRELLKAKIDVFEVHLQHLVQCFKLAIPLETSQHRLFIQEKLDNVSLG
jgi:hypothetical protein